MKIQIHRNAKMTGISSLGSLMEKQQTLGSLACLLYTVELGDQIILHIAEQRYWTSTQINNKIYLMIYSWIKETGLANLSRSHICGGYSFQAKVTVGIIYGWMLSVHTISICTWTRRRCFVIFLNPAQGKPFKFSHGSEARICGPPFSPKAVGHQPMRTKGSEVKNRVLILCMSERIDFQDQLQKGNSTLLGVNQGLCSLGEGSRDFQGRQVSLAIVQGTECLICIEKYSRNSRCFLDIRKEVELVISLVGRRCGGFRLWRQHQKKRSPTGKGSPSFVLKGSESYPDMADFHLNCQGPTSPPVSFFLMERC